MTAPKLNCYTIDNTQGPICTSTYIYSPFLDSLGCRLQSVTNSDGFIFRQPDFGDLWTAFRVSIFTPTKLFVRAGISSDTDTKGLLTYPSEVSPILVTDQAINALEDLKFGVTDTFCSARLRLALFGIYANSNDLFITARINWEYQELQDVIFLG
jgi:hypothetical protein